MAGIMASPVGSEEARVQVMTIHRAKGLEFDVVILPDLQRSPRRADRPLLYWTTIVTRSRRARHRARKPGGRGRRRRARGCARALDARAARRPGDLELGRLAYVAATRARRQLHLIGSVGVKASDDEAALIRPPAASLLGFLWPAVSELRTGARGTGLRMPRSAAAAGAASRHRQLAVLPPVSRRRSRRNPSVCRC